MGPFIKGVQKNPEYAEGSCGNFNWGAGIPGGHKEKKDKTETRTFKVRFLQILRVHEGIVGGQSSDLEVFLTVFKMLL